MPKVNYTNEQVKKLITLYSEKGNKGLDEIAETLEKSVPSIRAKLIKEGVYVPEEKKAATRKNGPSKKELLNTLRGITGLDHNGLDNATKNAIKEIIMLVKKKNKGEGE